MKRTLAVALVAVWVLAQAMSAQAPPQMPKPGPEHKRIGYFVGNWEGEGDAKQGPLGPAGKYTFTEHNEWFPGGFFLLAHADGKGPMGGPMGGEVKSLGVMGYNSEEKVHTYDAFNSIGMAMYAKGTVEGDTWTLTSESKMGGMPIKARFIIKELSPTSCSVKLESSMDGQTWSTIMEGKLTKAK